MGLFESKGTRRRWGLRTRLLTPIVVLVLLSVASLGLTSDLSTRALTDLLISQRAATALEGVAERLHEREQTQALLADLLAAERGLPALLERGEPAEIGLALAPLSDKLGLSHIAVYAPDGREALHSGLRVDGPELVPLIEGARAGHGHTAMTVTSDGLAVWAATSIPGPRDPAAVLVIGTLLGGDTLRAVKDREAIELAIFHERRLVSSTIADPGLLALLRESFSPGGPELLNEAFARSDFRAAARPLPNGGLLVALVPVGDLELVSGQRNLLMLLTTSALMLALLLVGILQARDIAGPLGTIIKTTRDLTQGDYHRRVPPNSIHELDNLGGAVNNLAEQLEIQLAEQLEVQLAELAHRAIYDSLTRLPNRALFMDRLAHALARAGRGQRSVAVLFMDLDNFKVINDSLGHQIGDLLLVAVAERLQLCLRPEDTVARLGGDEFTLLLEDVSHVSDAIRLAERVIEQLRAPFTIGGHQVFTAPSIGIAVSTPDHDQPGTLLRDADLAMYRAKSKGKGRFEMFDPDLKLRAMERLRLETDLRRAIDAGEFTLVYQPIVSLHSGRVEEIEALIRWEHPERGLGGPGHFIPLAEETGLILRLGRWVLEEACRQTQRWHQQFPADPPLVVSVNLSVRQFEYIELLQDVSTILQRTGLDPASLKLEITESFMMRDPEGTRGTLAQLKRLGLKLAIDDFGTGYSSLAYLRNFPIDTLKIDRSFVARLGQSAEDDAIVSIIVQLARTLDISVTGEGIENAGQLAFLRAIGCDRGQGYYFARPLNPEDTTIYLAQRTRLSQPAASEPSPLLAAHARLMARLNDQGLGVGVRSWGSTEAPAPNS